MNKSLVVGGESRIGLALTEGLRARGSSVAVTTRRSGSTDIFLDLSTEIDFSKLPKAPDVVFLCAAITSIAVCEEKKELSYRVNVEATLALGRWFLDHGSFVVFLSSNAVFNCENEFTPESSPYSYANEYGHQKAVAESGLLRLAGHTRRLAIVRLSKVVTSSEGVFSGFYNSLRAGDAFEAFNDVMISPVSLPYAVRSLLKIADARIGGVFHIGSKSEVSYADFARLMAQKLGRSGSQIKEVNSVEKNAIVYFRPRHPSLAMTESTLSLGLNPEPIDNVISYLVTEAGSAD